MQNANASSPPAYTPVQLSSFYASALGPSTLASIYDEDDRDSSEDISPIRLRVDASITISNNNNAVFLEPTPAEQAKSIANAVVKALRDHSSGQCGIPMIDENGRPRPIDVEVHAGLNVGGTGNIVGPLSISREYFEQGGRSTVLNPDH